MNGRSWQVSSGHADTTNAACEVLIDGGNAFDALIAAAWTACVAEPIFCSPGGGGHALLQPAGKAPMVLDCFTQTPQKKRTNFVDFYPIHGNFGTDTQEFHVGMGAAAAPGMVPGLFSLQQRFASRSMEQLAQPAIHLARDGVVLNSTQALALAILEPIVRSSPESAQLFGLSDDRSPLPEVGSRVSNPELADFMEQIARPGGEQFYQQQVAAQIAADAEVHGGHLQVEDFGRYRVHYRQPNTWTLGEWRVWSNPPPAFGGMMVTLMTSSLERKLPASARFGSAAHLDALLAAMHESQADRKLLEQPECLRSDKLLQQTYQKLIQPDLLARKGTTHISIRDRAGNLAAMTLSNGEGCGRVVSNCGFMLNNMLGEQDLNRMGFHHWPENRRLASMMAPTLAQCTGLSPQRLILGSGGSNRIRTAIAQVLCNVIHFDLPLQQAIQAPRMHLEDDALAFELPPSAWPDQTTDWLDQQALATTRWPQRNLYFGGVHAVSDRDAAADSRRDGAARSG